MSGYIGAQPVPQATQHREAFTATASQTSFPTAGYTPQFVDVYLNGVKLAAADYTATNGSDIVLATGAAVSDILEYVAYTPFEVASQTFTGTTTVSNLVATGTVTAADLTLESAVPRITLTDTDGTDQWTSIFEGGGNTYYISRNGANRGQHIWEQVAGGVYTHAMRLNSSGALLHGTTTAGSAGAGDIVVNGGVYLGGTAAANKLDDYEEGTFSATLGTSGFTTTLSSISGERYTKIGRMVFVDMTLSFTTTGYNADYSRIDGLPFAVNGDGCIASYSSGKIADNANGGKGIFGGGSSSLYLYDANNTITDTGWRVSGWYYT